MGKSKKINSFEDEVARLQEISSLLENNDIGLEEAISLYEEGIKLSKNCINKLKEAELKITELKKELTEISSDEDVED